MKVAVIGHVEWVQFTKVGHVPQAGEIIKSSITWSEPAGGGGVAATQLAMLAGNCTLFTAFGDDENGRRAIEQLEKLGIEVFTSIDKDTPSKEAFVQIDSNKERTITVMGDLKPSGNDTSLPWEKLAEMDAVYFVSGDVAALKAARQAKVLVATSRVLPVLQEASIKLDALVMSRKDSGETYMKGALQPEPSLIVRTDGKHGGSTESGEQYVAELVTADELRDTYGCGDSFAAGLAYGLGKGLEVSEVLKLASHWGAMAAKRDGANMVLDA